MGNIVPKAVSQKANIPVDLFCVKFAAGKHGKRQEISEGPIARNSFVVNLVKLSGEIKIFLELIMQIGKAESTLIRG